MTQTLYARMNKKINKKIKTLPVGPGGRGMEASYP
jgi:hypothetical protein